MVRKSLGASTLLVLAMSVLVLAMSVPASAQYMSTPPPAQQAAPGQPPTGRADSFTLIPKNGQSEKQQWADRYECHKWAKDQSGFDPTLQPPGGLSGAEINSRRDQYRRAFSACIEGRGYSVQYGQAPSPTAAPVAAAGTEAVAGSEAVASRSHWVRSEPEMRYRPFEGQIQGGYVGTVGNSDHELDDGTTVGFGFTWWPTSAVPVGLRLNGNYSSFRARDPLLAQFGPNVYRGWQNIYGGDADLQFDFARVSPRSKFYLLGGAGWYREQTQLRAIVYETGTFCGFYNCGTGTFPVRVRDDETSSWRSSWNAGLGWELAYADGASLFVEARYWQMAPRDDKQQFVPVTVGLRF